jgi:sugar lactone lactonase YvrE
VAADSAGTLFIADNGNNRVRKVSPDGLITTVAGGGPHWPSEEGSLATATELRSPTGIAVDAAGNLFVSDSSLWGRGGRDWIVKVFGIAAPGLIGGRPLTQRNP